MEGFWIELTKLEVDEIADMLGQLSAEMTNSADAQRAGKLGEHIRGATPSAGWGGTGKVTLWFTERDAGLVTLAQRLMYTMRDIKGKKEIKGG